MFVARFTSQTRYQIVRAAAVLSMAALLSMAPVGFGGVPQAQAESGARQSQGHWRGLERFSDSNISDRRGDWRNRDGNDRGLGRSGDRDEDSGGSEQADSPDQTESIFQLSAPKISLPPAPPAVDPSDQADRPIEVHGTRDPDRSDVWQVSWTRQTADSIEVHYIDGWSEVLRGDRYILIDDQQRIVIERNIRPDDVSRLERLVSP